MAIVVTAQPQPLLTSADGVVRQALALDATDRNTQVDLLLLAAQAELDGPLGWVGLCVAQQTLDVTAHDFSCPILLPGPIIGDVVVTYLDGSGASQTLDASVYVVSGGTVSLASGQSWPTVADQSGAVSFAYDVGIEDETDPRIRLMKLALIVHAQMTLDGADPAQSRATIENLVRPLKVWTV